MECLGPHAEKFTLGERFSIAWDWYRTIMEADLARNFQNIYESGRDQLSASLRGQIERGRTVTAVDYNAALDGVDTLNLALEEVFFHYDAIITPATAGTAPK